MNTSSDGAIDRVRVREVAGVFCERGQLDTAVDALLLAGFDRADVDLMAGADTVSERLGSVYVPAEELVDIPGVPRRAFIGRDDVNSAVTGVAALLAYVGAIAAAFGIVASGGAVASALVAGAAGAATTGGIGVMLAHLLGRKAAGELETQLAAGGLVLWVRVHSPEREQKAQSILHEHGAAAVRVHEIEIDKRLEDLPLGSIKVDPWLGEPLAKP
jgi:hypothetical protein